jgi:hypothetical protein
MGLLLSFRPSGIHSGVLTKRVYIDEETVPVVFMFLESFALRPFLPLAASTFAVVDSF